MVDPKYSTRAIQKYPQIPKTRSTISKISFLNGTQVAHLMSVGQTKGTPDMKTLTKWELLAHGSHWGKNGNPSIRTWPVYNSSSETKTQPTPFPLCTNKRHEVPCPPPPAYTIQNCLKLQSLSVEKDESYSRTEQWVAVLGTRLGHCPWRSLDYGDIQEGSTRSQYFFT